MLSPPVLPLLLLLMVVVLMVPSCCGVGSGGGVGSLQAKNVEPTRAQAKETQLKAVISSPFTR